MVMFTAHIALMLEILTLAAGLVALHYGQELQAKLIKAAGVLLAIFSVSSVLCTGFYAVKYFMMGHYEHAYDFNITMEGNGPHYHCSSSIGD